jgi:DNA-binding transcriptional regulator YdaS (Cro superfamily)
MRPLTAKETKLFTYLKKQYSLKNSVALAKFLNVSPAALSKIRHGVKPYTAEFVLAVYDATGLSIENIRRLMKD